MVEKPWNRVGWAKETQKLADSAWLCGVSNDLFSIVWGKTEGRKMPNLMKLKAPCCVDR